MSLPSIYLDSFSHLPPPPLPRYITESKFISIMLEKLATFGINIVITYLVLSFCVDVASDSKLAPSTSSCDHPVVFSVEIQAKPSFRERVLVFRVLELRAIRFETHSRTDLRFDRTHTSNTRGRNSRLDRRRLPYC